MLFSLLFELALDARQVDPHALVLYPSRGRERWPVPMPTKGGILTLFTSISRLSTQTAGGPQGCERLRTARTPTMGVCARKGCSVRRSMSALVADHRCEGRSIDLAPHAFTRSHMKRILAATTAALMMVALVSSSVMAAPAAQWKTF